MTINRRAALARRMQQPGLIVAPGVFELISAKIADPMGFDCLYVTGYGLVASHLGLPDAGLAAVMMLAPGGHGLHFAGLALGLVIVALEFKRKEAAA